MMQTAVSHGLTHLAITDHDRIDVALKARDVAPEGLTVIVGEEVKTLDGDLICLFLERAIEPGSSAADTIAAAREQGALVGIPHPFDRMRGSLLRDAAMASLAPHVDWVETHNARVVGHGNEDAAVFAREHDLPGIAVSDAHSIMEIGIAYTALDGDSVDARRPARRSSLGRDRPRPGQFLHPDLDASRKAGQSRPRKWSGPSAVLRPTRREPIERNDRERHGRTGPSTGGGRRLQVRHRQVPWIRRTPLRTTLTRTLPTRSQRRWTRATTPPKSVDISLGQRLRQPTPPERTTRGSITHSGDPRLRSKLIQASWSAIRQDGELLKFFRTVAKKHPRHLGPRVAIVAVAHKLCMRAAVVLMKQRPYEIREKVQLSSSHRRGDCAPGNDSTTVSTRRKDLLKVRPLRQRSRGVVPERAHRESV